MKRRETSERDPGRKANVDTELWTTGRTVETGQAWTSARHAYHGDGSENTENTAFCSELLTCELSLGRARKCLWSKQNCPSCISKILLRLAAFSASYR